MIISLRTPRPRGAVGARDSAEHHRVSTPLELFFDLCFVVAVGQAGRELAHAVGQGRVGHGVSAYLAVFFAVWWAWMNYSWFATAFDPDDIPFRLATFVQIAGSLVIAAGVPRAFEHRDFTVVVIGYVIVRLAFASQWIRVYRDNPEFRGLAVRWGGGVLVVQVLWVALQWVHSSTLFDALFLVLVVVELAVPYWAGRAGELPFHPHHIAERYGLFTLIVLGETVSAATVAIQEAMSAHEDVRELVLLALGGLLIVFSAWWIYFAHEVGDLLGERTSPYLWGYGHYVVFAAAASIGAGAEVVAAWTAGTEEISARLAAASVTVPTAVFLLVVWALQARHFKRGPAQAIMPVTAAAVLLCSFAGTYAVLLAGLCCTAAVIVGIYGERFGTVGSEPSRS
ncbi:MAG TPA: low temperature requirement protein A [Actinospica sp.]|nr:low temperature requirement protein A [Actinospica sp.]